MFQFFLLYFTIGFAGCIEDKAKVKFFVDINSKAPQPGYTVQFTFVIWNEGRVEAKNVVLSDSLIQLEPYEHLSHITYVRNSMGICREYDPNKSEESYYFVDRVPLTDENDNDEGTFDETANTATFKTARIPPGGYLIWAFKVKIDNDAPCELNPSIQNIATVSADNSDPYKNDVIAHIVCQSPKLKVKKTADKSEIPPGGNINYTLNYSLDFLSIPEVDSLSFDIKRVRIYDYYPADLIEITSIENGGEENSGVIFWEIPYVKNGGSGEISYTAKVKQTITEGTLIENRAEILSQNTVFEQNEGGNFTVVVISR